MAKLTPIDHDPFGADFSNVEASTNLGAGVAAQPALTPVDNDPFAEPDLMDQLAGIQGRHVRALKRGAKKLVTGPLAVGGELINETIQKPVANLFDILTGGNAAELGVDDPLGGRAAIEYASTAGKAMRAEAEADLAEAGGRPTIKEMATNPLRAFDYVGGQVVESLPAMAATVATGGTLGIPAASAVMGGTTGASQLEEARSAGLGLPAAIEEALLTGAAESAGELVGLPKLLTPFKRTEGVLAEGASEAVTQLAQGQILDESRGVVTPIEEQIRQAFDAMLAGTGAAAPVGLVGAAADAGMLPPQAAAPLAPEPAPAPAPADPIVDIVQALASGIEPGVQGAPQPIVETTPTQEYVRGQAEVQEGSGEEAGQAAEVGAPGRAGEAQAVQQGPVSEAVVDPLAPRIPEAPALPPDATREQLIAEYRAAPSPGEKSAVAARIAAFDAQEQERATQQASDQARGASDVVDAPDGGAPAASLAQPLTTAGLPAGMPAAASGPVTALDDYFERRVPGFTRGSLDVEVRDAGDGTSPEGELKRVYKDLFGLDTVVFRTNDPQLSRFNGMARVPGAPNTAFINENGDDSFVTVLSHEFGHELRAQRPDLYDGLVDKLRNNAQLTKYLSESLYPRMTPEQTSVMTTDMAREELISDTWQRLLTDKTFVAELAAEEPGLFVQLKDAVLAFLDRTLGKLRDIGADGTKYYRDVVAMRKAFKETATTFARERAAQPTKEPAAVTEQATPPAVDEAFSRRALDTGLRIAVRLKDGRVISDNTKRAYIHSQLYDNPIVAKAFQEDRLGVEHGFIDRDGNYLTREEASDRVEARGPSYRNDDTFSGEELRDVERGKLRPMASRAKTPSQLLRNLTPQEQAKVTDKVAAKIIAQLQSLPDPKEMAAVAYAGKAKRGWYRKSADAISAVFGPDAPRFAGLLAALSPQVSVETNLRNALNVWQAWDKAGRPQDREQIVDIMAANVEGSGSRNSVLGAWINNSVRALTGLDPSRIMLSGPKVDSFMRNLLGDVMEVTNDTWMANYAAVNQTIFKGGLTKSGKDPGKGTGYLAMNALTRQAAQQLTKLTGETWTPAEVQETVWSWGRVLSNMAGSAEEIRDEVDLVNDRAITDELIASTPDFGTLFTDPEYAAILEEAGYGEQLEDLRNDALRSAAREAREEPADGGKAGPFAPEAQARFERAAAKRLRQARTNPPAAKRAEDDAVALAADDDFIPFSRRNPAAEVYGANEGFDLIGMPNRVNIPGRGPVNFHGFKPAQEIAVKYAKKHGTALPKAYAPVDVERAERIAAEYEKAKHKPKDPEVLKAYTAMIDETLAQYRDILKTGLQVEFIEGADPYAATPREAILDVVENNHLWVFPTDAGFGSSDLDVSDNPLLAPTEFEISGKKAVANDIFRVVHDYFGHIANGVGFRADGEENAWREHSAMYSPLARRAMTSETRGQNSWVNYGPHGEKNRTASSADTTYADQKTTLLPEWVSEDGAADPLPVVASRRAGFNAKPIQPDAVSVDAIHYSNSPNLKAVDPSYSGTGRIGATQRRRFGQGRYGTKGGTSARAYFFVRDGSQLPSTAGVIVGAHPYEVRLNNLYDQDADPRGIAARNGNNVDAMEEEISEAGFDGLLSSAIGDGSKGSVAIVFDIGDKKIPVQPVEQEQLVASRRSQQPFYSALHRAIQEGKGAPKKADATAWKQWLDGAQRRGEIKQSERDWLGVDAWLTERGTTSRAELEAFVAANQVTLNSVALGDTEASEDDLPEGWEVERMPNGEWVVWDDGGEQQADGDTESDAIRNALSEAAVDGVTKFHRYQLPGGENYRELLLTLPVKKPTTANELAMELFGRGYNDLTADEQAAVAEHGAGLPTAPEAGFLSSHFDQPNILAHVRYNERTDADGRRVLFIEEIQSDWHQAGRKKGYNVSNALRPRKDGDAWVLRTAQGTGPEIEFSTEAEASTRAAEMNQMMTEGRALDGVPDAPFKATDEWAMLAFKRMVRHAAENGFDRIAWTTGEQQAERYDLSKMVEDIRYSKNDDGTYKVIARKKDSESAAWNDDAATIQVIEATLGKEIAEKVQNEEGEQKGTKAPYRVLSGLDLKVGGEGMKAFYDKILPSAVNKWAKRFGGRVAETSLPLAVAGTTEAGDTAASGMTPAEWNALPWFERDKLRAKAGSLAKVHAIDLTPAMRDAALEGLPMFSRKTPAMAQQQRATQLGALAQAGFPQGSPTQVPPGRFVPVKAAVDMARVKLQDKLLPVLRAQDRTGAKTDRGISSITLDDAMNAYRMENLMHGKVKDRQDAANIKFILPMQAQLKRLGLSTAQLEDYLYARHARERNAAVAKINQAMPDGGSGLTNQEAADILAGNAPGPYSGKVLDNATIQKLANVAQKIDAMRDLTIDNMVEAGQITPKLAATLRAKYKNYVPLRGKESDSIWGPSGMGTGKGLSNKKSPLKRALGRGKGNHPENILGEVVGDLQRSIIAAEKKKPAQALLKFALANPMPELFTVEPVDMEWKFSEATGEAYLGVRSSAEDAERSILVNHNGNQVRIRFEDPELRDAVMNMGVDDMSGFVKIAGAVNRWRSAVLTRFNPGFAPVNVIRDLMFGMTGLATEKGPAAAASAALRYGPSLAALWRDAKSQPGNASVPNAQKSMDDWAREYAESGAKTGLTQVDDVRDLQRRLQIASTALMQLAAEGRAVRLASEALIRTGKPIVETIERINDATENALRLSAYIGQRKAGVSIDKSAEYAKNLTINFNRKGQWGSILNAVYLFFNAAIQGTHAVQRVMRRPGAQAFVAGLAGLQYVMALSMMGDDDEDGLSAWDKVPDYVKRTSIVFPLGGLTGDDKDYFALPMPYGFNVFPYMGGRLAQHQAQGKRPTDASVVADLTKSLTEAFSPVPVAEGYAGMFGDTLGFAMSLAANRDDLGAPIAKEDPYAKSQPPKALEGLPSTARPYHVAAQLLAKLGGADLEERIPPIGFLDVAPEQLEEVVGFITGGLGNIGNQGFRWWEQLQAGNLERSMDQITAFPIAKRFIGTANEARAVADRYYGERSELDRKHQVVQDRLRRGDDLFEVADKAAEDPTMQGLTPAVYKSDGAKGGARGDFKRTESGGVQIDAEEGSVTAAMKASEKAVKSMNAAIRGLRDDDITNAQVLALLQDTLEEGNEFYEELGLPPTFDLDATAPTRIRNRAIRLVQDQRKGVMQGTLKTIKESRGGR